MFRFALLSYLFVWLVCGQCGQCVVGVWLVCGRCVVSVVSVWLPSLRAARGSTGVWQQQQQSLSLLRGHPGCAMGREDDQCGLTESVLCQLWEPAQKSRRRHGLSKRRPRSLEAAVTFLRCQPGMELISLHPGCDCGWNKGTKAIWSASPGGDRTSLPAAQTCTQESLIWSHSVIPHLTLSQQP